MTARLHCPKCDHAIDLDGLLGDLSSPDVRDIIQRARDLQKRVGRLRFSFELNIPGVSVKHEPVADALNPDGSTGGSGEGVG